MQYIYHCKHCQTIIDTLETEQMLAEKQLGFDELSVEEYTNLVSYDDITNKVFIKTVCDYCYEAIKRNPELSLLSSPLQ